MAYQLAVAKAAELSLAVPESFKLLGDETGKYEDDLAGAWTKGE